MKTKGKLFLSPVHRVIVGFFCKVLTEKLREINVEVMSKKHLKLTNHQFSIYITRPTPKSKGEILENSN